MSPPYKGSINGRLHVGVPDGGGSTITILVSTKSVFKPLRSHMTCFFLQVTAKDAASRRREHGEDLRRFL